VSKLRERLRASPPHVSLRQGWGALIAALRAVRRAGGEPVQLHSRAAIDRALDTEVAADIDVSPIKAGIRALLQAAEGADRQAIAVEVDAAICALLPSVVTSPVRVSITGWPPAFNRLHQARFIGMPLEALDALAPVAAATLIHHVDGALIAGHRLCTQAQLAPRETLPPIPRDRRGRKRPSGAEPWLAHIDDEGRWSATPRALAEAHAAAMAGVQRVIDPFCGCGADAIAFGLAGHRVLAIERNPDRAALARANVAAMGLEGCVEVRVADANEAIEALAQEDPDAGLFLDPPWGGPEAVQDSMSWSTLVPAAVARVAPVFKRVVVKAPRSFDVRTMPDWGQPWRVDYGFRSGAQPPDTIAMLRICSHR
jgi:predicted RNA methylase